MPMHPPKLLLAFAAGPLAFSAVFAADAFAQGTQSRLEDGKLVDQRPPAEGSDEAVMSRTRALLADGKVGEARSLIEGWLKENARSDSPYLAEAYLLRGDCKLADGDEFDAMYDYEKVVNEFPGSDQFVIALERELDVALLYFGGLRKRLWGMRIDSGVPIAEEIVVRIGERLPKSRLAERAMLEMGDFYYRKQDLKMSEETYDVFLSLFPESEHRVTAVQRRAYSSIARFKGPQYDASGLKEARAQIVSFRRTDPEEAENIGLDEDLLLRLDDALAAQMLVNAKWYIRRNDAPSARLTLRRLIAKYPDSPAAEEAIRIFEEKGWPLTQAAAPARPAATTAPEAAPPSTTPAAPSEQPAQPGQGTTP